jgi:hypothetical protein
LVATKPSPPANWRVCYNTADFSYFERVCAVRSVKDEDEDEDMIIEAAAEVVCLFCFVLFCFVLFVLFVI